MSVLYDHVQSQEAQVFTTLIHFYPEADPEGLLANRYQLHLGMRGDYIYIDFVLNARAMSLIVLVSSRKNCTVPEKSICHS